MLFKTIAKTITLPQRNNLLFWERAQRTYGNLTRIDAANLHATRLVLRMIVWPTAHLAKLTGHIPRHAPQSYETHTAMLTSQMNRARAPWTLFKVCDTT